MSTNALEPPEAGELIVAPPAAPTPRREEPPTVAPATAAPTPRRAEPLAVAPTPAASTPRRDEPPTVAPVPSASATSATEGPRRAGAEATPKPEPPLPLLLPTFARTDAIRKAAGAWIAAADLKATALIAIAGAMAALVVPSFTAPGVAKLPAAPWLMVLFGFANIVAVIAAAMVLWPRTNRRRILEEKNWPPNPKRSLSFFGDIAEMSREEMRAALVDATEGIEAEDSFEQAMVISVIAQKKMFFMRIAVGALGAGLTVAAFALLTATWQAMQPGQPAGVSGLASGSATVTQGLTPNSAMLPATPSPSMDLVPSAPTVSPSPRRAAPISNIPQVTLPQGPASASASASASAASDGSVMPPITAPKVKGNRTR